jgi:hypothetical protein
LVPVVLAQIVLVQDLVVKVEILLSLHSQHLVVVEVRVMGMLLVVLVVQVEVLAHQQAVVHIQQD